MNETNGAERAKENIGMYPGIKLSCTWRETAAWARWNDAHPRPLAALGALGIESVEFSLWHRPQARQFTAEEEVERVWEEARRCMDDGLRVHVHPYVHIDHRGPAHMADATRGPVVEHIHRAASLAAKILEKQQKSVTLVYHPADAEIPEDYRQAPLAGEWRQELQRRSAAFFVYAQTCVAPYAPDIVVACETQVPSTPRKIRIGDRPGELIEIATAGDCRICWDTGHLLNSAHVLGFEPTPPDAFLGRLGHVHLHAVVDGKDHQPATPDNGYLRQCLRRMRASNFRGCVTLEYGIARTPDETPEQMQRTIEAGVATIQAAQSEGTHSPAPS